jgi:RHS repeat-associated protein
MTGSLTVRRNTSTGSGNPSFASSATPTASLSSGNLYPIGVFAYLGKGLQRMDINGDGRQDLSTVVIVPYFVNGQQQGYTSYYVMLLGTDTGFATANGNTWVQSGSYDSPALHFNGDQCTDRLFGNQIFIATCSGAAASVVNVPATPLQLLDWNGDGKTDMLVDNGGTFGVYLSTGSGFSSLQTTAIPSAGNFFVLDQDGDGLEDLIRLNGSSALSYWTHTASGAVPGPYVTNVPDLLSNVTDGYGVSISPSYTSTAWGNYDKGAATNYPVQESGPRIVVAKVTASDGIGGTFDKNYFYVGARKNPLRRESLGFQRFDETDARNGLISRTYFEQTFPRNGMVNQHETMQSNGTTAISRVVNINDFATLDSAAYNQRYFTFPLGSTATQYEVGGTWNGNLVRTVTTSNTFDNPTGTLYDQTVTTTEPAAGANGVTAGGTWTARTYSPTANFYNNTSNWCIGRPGRTQQINSHNLTYGSSITRTTDTVWNTTLCRPTQIVEEPGNPTLQVTTALDYDGFGNVNSTIVTGIGMPARTTTTIYSDATYTTGQFPLSIKNALDQSTTIAWNHDLGVPLSSTNPNGLSDSWLYDAWGRRTKHTHIDGTSTTWTVNNCSAVSGGCVGSQNQTVVIETELTRSGGFVKDTWSYLDKFDRAIIGTTRLLSGAYNRIDREYDALGRVYRDSAPCLWSSCSTYWTTNSYDLADRLTQISRPVSDSDSTLQYTYLYYEGLTSRVVDAQSKQSTKIVNALGELARSTDHDGYYQAFDYDAFSAPKRVQDSAGNTLQSSTYNLRGMLTARTDMDMGTWTFTPNALGEVVSQIDAKNQTSTFGFDLLGRLTTRTEAEGTSTWTWGTSAAAKNIGLLSGISGPGYSEAYTYTQYSEPTIRVITAGGATYQFNYSWNAQGKLYTLKYPVSTSGYRLEVRHNYQNGVLQRISDHALPTTVFWTANANDASNRITQETLNNGLVTNRSTDAVTGWLKSIQTGVGGGGGVQSLAYEWDKVGNLKQRKDINQSSLTEDFFYDNLYRLDYSNRNGVENLNLAYDALGNITSKSDVGSYTYHAAKKHQVISTSNGWSFSYDNNGNMISGRGATLTWTSYNYAASIANGSNTSTFDYTPDRQYWRQVSNYTSGGTATTIYAGGLFEKVTTSAGTDYRHFIKAGGSTIIVSRQSTGTNSFHYVTSDHLGSSSAVTNSAGGILVNSSFDAFGKRRGSNWSGSPSAGDWTAIASTTRRGYTDHTMLDNLGLIHMNGRVQDPLLGRFVSADPSLPGVSTQDFNRYTYVRNNPLSLADPTGFVPNGNFNAPERTDGDDGMLWGTAEVARTGALTAFQTRYPGGNAPSVWDYDTFSAWFRGQHMRGHRGPGAALRQFWTPASQTTVEPLGDAGPAESSSSTGYWTYVIQPLPTFSQGNSGGMCDICHRPAVPRAPDSPGFWEAGGFAWNISGAGIMDCFFNLGPLPCDASATEIGLHVAGTALPFLRGLGPATRGVVAEGTTVYRVWGDAATAGGRSWTTVNPASIGNFRNIGGLPSQNSGRFVSEGVVRDTTGITSRSALPLHGNRGGLPELIFPDPATQIELTRVSGVNPPY